MTAANKSSKKKQQKVLSQAAQKRLEQERLEAQKTKAQKLAEVIKKKNFGLSKHDTVVEKLNEIKAAASNKKALKLNPVKKVKQQAPMDRTTSESIRREKLAAQQHQHHQLLSQATQLRLRFAKEEARLQTKFQETLRDCYGIYELIEASPEPYAFYDILRDYFKLRGINIQSNTPTEALLIRFVFEKKTTKQISEYATVLRYALETKVPKNDFTTWYKKTTQTRILQKARESKDNRDYKDRIARAKVMLLRYFDIREQWPLGKFDYPAMLAAKQVHLPNDLIVVICRGYENFNRDLYFDPDQPHRTSVPTASIVALHFIPPNIDIVNDMMHRLAKFLEPRLEQFEEEIQRKIEQVWADDMSNYLQERELGAAYRSTDRWADRMQAAIEEDQVAFEKKRKKIQKLREEARSTT